jgi:hypothetical protein
VINSCTILGEIPEVRDHLLDLDVYGRMILKLRMCTEFNWLRIGSVVEVF